jgi:serine protease
MHRLITSLFLISALLVPSGPAAAEEFPPPGWTDQLIITYASSSARSSARPLPAGVQKVRVDGKRVVLDLGRPVLKSDLTRFTDPLIVAVEPDLRVFPTFVPNDSNFSSQWDMSNASAGAADYSVRAPGAWEYTRGSADITVAVLDTGITTHREFTGRTVAGYDFVSDPATANDGGGRDSNPADPGDWVTSSESTQFGGDFEGCDVENSSWHGTHVAGTIGATGNNSTGIAGLNWVSKIQPIRVLGKCGGSLYDVADAIEWAAGGSVLGVPENATPAKVINISLGAPTISDVCPTFLQSSINEARSLGALVVVAAGNDTDDAAYATPANCNGVITVAATARNGKRAYYSNFGEYVDIAAPGGDYRVDSEILSTLNSGTSAPRTSSSGQIYGSYQGTSMAAPHVAGVLSLLLSIDPTLTETEVRALMASTATPFPSDTGASPCSTANTCGAGIINATALILAALPEQEAQTINFPELENRYVGAANFDPGASATSELPVSYSVSTTSICRVSGGLITIRSSGVCSITASQPGNLYFLPAPPVTRSVTFVSPVKPSPTTDPSVTAEPIIGSEAVASAGVWTGTPTPSVSLQWYRCTRLGSATTSRSVPSRCASISGAITSAYTPDELDEGRYLRVGETASNVGGSVTRFSATSLAVVMPPTPPYNIAEPSVPTAARSGTRMSASVGSFGGSKPISIAYTWYACSEEISASSSTRSELCTLIPGESSARYRPSAAMVGRFIVIGVTASNTYGSITTYSASSGAVR